MARSNMNALGIVTRPQLGGAVDAYCGRCKEVREHVIAALNTRGDVERVQCRTCQSNHLFKQKQPKTSSTRTTRASNKDALSAVDESAPSRAYSMQERFNVGERLEHPK